MSRDALVACGALGVVLLLAAGGAYGGEEAQAVYGPEWFTALHTDKDLCEALASETDEKVDPCANEGRLEPVDVAVAALAELIAHHSNAEVREHAIAILGHLGSTAAAPAVPALITALNKHRNVRMRAAIVLGLIGARAEAAIPALTEAQNDRHPLVQYWAKKALQQIRQGASYEPAR